MMRGGYQLELWCDSSRHRDGLLRAHDRVQFSGNSLQDCLAQARLIRWKVDARRLIALCPKCSRQQSLKHVPQVRLEAPVS